MESLVTSGALAVGLVSPPLDFGGVFVAAWSDRTSEASVRSRRG